MDENILHNSQHVGQQSGVTDFNWTAPIMWKVIHRVKRLDDSSCHLSCFSCPLLLLFVSVFCSETTPWALQGHGLF